jgi:hypothetical protein
VSPVQDDSGGIGDWPLELIVGNLKAAEALATAAEACPEGGESFGDRRAHGREVAHLLAVDTESFINTGSLHMSLLPAVVAGDMSSVEVCRPRPPGTEP